MDGKKKVERVLNTNRTDFFCEVFVLLRELHRLEHVKALENNVDMVQDLVFNVVSCWIA